MGQLHPYLYFNGTTQQAMEFYQTCFGGQLNIMRVGDSPMATQMPSNMHQRVLHATLVNDRFTIMASDWMEPGSPVLGNNVRLGLVYENDAEIHALFDALSAAGSITHPLQQEFFGTMGELVDQFGVYWMLQMDPPRA